MNFALTLLCVAGSVASIFGAVISCYVLWRELSIGAEVHKLKTEEERWHKEKENASSNLPIAVLSHPSFVSFHETRLH